MNTHFLQVEKRSQMFSYLLAAFAIGTAMMLILSLSHSFENRWSMPDLTRIEQPGKCTEAFPESQDGSEPHHEHI
jgi:hypothetical protein